MSRKSIALLAGGNSSESVISVKSAESLIKEIDPHKFEHWLIKVKGLEWSCTLHDGRVFHIDKNDFSLNIDGRKILFDCVLMAIHGNPGEDGFLQAYFTLLGIPVTTCNMFVSALTFNKFACKAYLKAFEIHTPKALLIRKNDIIDPSDLSGHLGLPLFIKPNNGGSSFGASKVKQKNDVFEALNKAFKHDNEAIAEEFVDGNEITCGISRLNGKPYFLPPTEVIPKNEFFDYEAKYTDGKSEEITPARLSQEQIEQCQHLSLKIYDLLGCNGVVRIDYILRNGIFHFIEVNTVPGMSAASIVPKQVRTSGISMGQFIELLINDATGRK